MTTMRKVQAAGATIVAALSVSSLLLLSGCEERPYPTADKGYAEAPKAPPAPLAGAPSEAPPPPPAYAPPPPAYQAPPQAYYPAPAIVAMAPIPNPGEPGADGYYNGGYGRRVHTHLYASPAPYAPKPPAYTKPPVYTPKPAPPKPPVYAAKPPPPAYVPKPTPPAPPVYVAKPAPPPAYVAKPPVVPPAPPVYAAKPPVTPTAPPAYAAKPPVPAPVTAADRASHLAALQSVLTDAISKGAVLTAPERFTANQPADVSLTVPAAFADTLRTEAQKDGLADAAASVNITAVLSGDGFSVTPDETQAQPLTAGQPTEFRWTVTAQPGAKGPLHADVGADLLGGGSDTLALGSVQKQAGLGVKPTPRMVGAAILVLILALVVVWLARGRGPSRPASARAASRAARTRPLDMASGSPGDS